MEIYTRRPYRKIPKEGIPDVTPGGGWPVCPDALFVLRAQRASARLARDTAAHLFESYYYYWWATE